MRAGLALIGAVALVGCAAGEPREVSLSGLSAPPPNSLAEIAAEVREAGGFVFVGTPNGDTVATDSVYMETPYEGVRVEFPRATGTLTVVDALGATMDGEMLVVATAGPARLVGEDGRPSADYVLSEGDPDVWADTMLPEDGTWLLFTRPHEGDEVIFWRAAIEGETVSGAHTLEGGSTPLDEFRETP